LRGMAQTQTKLPHFSRQNAAEQNILDPYLR
jgi:hypothetical protein